MDGSGTSGIEMSDGRIVHPEHRELMGQEVAEPNEAMVERFLQIVATRDADALNMLVSVEYPTVLWGKATSQLSAEDDSWARNALRD